MRLRHVWVFVCAAMAAATSVGCASQRPATQVTVFVDAEPLTRAETRRLELIVTGGPAGTTLLDAGDPIVFVGPFLWPYDVTVVPAGGDATRLFEVQATSYDAGGRVVSQARVRAGYVAHESRTLHLTLEDACRGVTCPVDQACHDGQCVMIMVPIDRDAGVVDADAGAHACTADQDCDDHNACNGSEVCTASACHSRGDRIDCDDHVSCTVDSCDGHDCVHTPTATLCTAQANGTCDPTNDCQYGTCSATNCVSNGCQTASCSNGTCVRTFACATDQTCCGTACVPTGCDDGESCTMDFCDATSSSCHHDPQLGSCDDHDPCTTVDACSAGACVGSGALACNDGHVCTTDTCMPGVGCTSIGNSLPCDDGDPCTVGDQCGGALCQPGTRMTCDDGVACTTDSCSAGTCMHAPGTCAGGGTCDPVNGCQTGTTCSAVTCMDTPSICEHAACSGNTCMRSTTCAGATSTCCGGTCVAAGCSDGNPCTDDACGPSGCTHLFNAVGCDDGDSCTSGDACAAGSCHGMPMDCDDLNSCSTDTCSGGICLHAPDPTGTCDDGDPCTVGDHCQGLLCRHTTCPSGTTCCDSGCTQPHLCV